MPTENMKHSDFHCDSKGCHKETSAGRTAQKSPILFRAAGRPKKYYSVLRRSASLPLIVLRSGRKTIQMAKGLGAAATLRNAYGNQNWENAEQPHGALLLLTVSEHEVLFLDF